MWCWHFFHEPFGMSRIGCAQHLLSLFDYCFCFAIMESLWRQQADAGMMMFLVVPGKERLTKLSGILNAAKPIWEAGAIFQGFELSFRVRIVVAGVWSGVCFGYSQIGHKEGLRLGFHGRASVGVNR